MVASHRNREYRYGEYQEFRIIIADYYDRYGPDDVVSPIDLGCYLILFGEVCDSIHLLGSDNFQSFDIRALQESLYSGRYRSDESLEIFALQIENIWDRLPIINKNRTLKQIAEAASVDTERASYRRNEAVSIRKISRNSPIEMICYGMPWVLAAAAIFSGGTIKFSGFECRLPPIGDGILSLRQALSQNRRTRPRIPRDKIKDRIEKD